MSVRAGEFTIEDYRKLPEGDRHQLIEGALVLTPSPSTKHQWILGRLFLVLSHYAEQRGGRVFQAPLDVYLDPRNAFQPDLVYVSADREAIIREDGIHGPPDLVVEVLSAGSQAFDRGQKRDVYYNSGVLEYWLVDPEAETVEVLVRGEGGYVLHGTYARGASLSTPAFPDLHMPVTELFRY